MYEPNEPTIRTDKDGKPVLQFKNLKDFAAYRKKHLSNFVEEGRRGSSADDKQAVNDFAHEFYAGQTQSSSPHFQTGNDPMPNPDGAFGSSFGRK